VYLILWLSKAVTMLLLLQITALQIFFHFCVVSQISYIFPTISLFLLYIHLSDPSIMYWTLEFTIFMFEGDHDILSLTVYKWKIAQSILEYYSI
jgi:hypothetical protein